MPSPSEYGFRFPAEWEPHAATWLTWPWPDGCSFPDNYDKIQKVYASLIRTLIPHESVRLNVWDAEMECRIRDTLSDWDIPLDNVVLHHHPAYEPWCRDHGPVYLKDNAGNKAIVNWGYNAWGGKYPPWERDNAIPGLVAEAQNLRLFEPDMILEGGSIETDGGGTLLTTESCLLNPNRNPSLTRQQIEQRLREYLGITDILWLGDGIVGDDTDGHIDDLARFVSPDTIATIVEEDPADENYAALQDNLARLRSQKKRDGTPYRIVELPMPEPRYWGELRLPASYANFYIANDIVIVPTFDDPMDARALDLLRFEFPHREVIGLDSTELIVGQGSFHCITQQEPA
jgi:agmatine deiminase